MKEFVATRQVRCRSPREALWCAIADTEELNRLLGMPELTVEPGGAGAARFTLGARLSGLRMRFHEEPFEWSAPEHLQVRRRFLNGPVRDYRFRVDFEDDGDGTLVAVELALNPRSAIGWPFVWLNGVRFADKLRRTVAEIDERLAGEGADRAVRRGTRSTAATVALAAARSKLLASVATQDAPLAERLVDHVASEVALARLRPYELADDWGEPPRQVLAVCLHAVVAGLLELHWEIICPSCRLGADAVSTLAELDESAHCHMCDISIGVELARAVEATFRPARAIGVVASGPLCIGGPRLTPHVVGQAVLRGGGRAELRAPAASGRCRLFVRGGATCSVDVRADGDPAATVRAGSALLPGQLVVAPGATIEIVDEGGDDRHVKLERLEWATRAATAHDVATSSAFRSLFSAEVLRPGLSLEVARVGLLFTDLAGSTALYAEVGDAAAYAVVQDHFDALAAAVDQCGGAVVKTIGDAIMAAFPSDEASVMAAVAMQRAYQELAARHPLAARMRLRVGGFAGACYMVTANDLLDYFGQSVNIAGRVQGLAEGGDIVLPSELVRRGQDAGWLAGTTSVESFAAELKGVRAPVEVTRLQLDDATAVAARQA